MTLNKIISKYNPYLSAIVQGCIIVYLYYVLRYLIINMFEPALKSVFFISYQLLPIFILMTNRIGLAVMNQCKYALIFVFSTMEAILYFIVIKTGVHHEEKLFICYLFTLTFYVCVTYVIGDACKVYPLLNKKHAEQIHFSDKSFYKLHEKLKTLKVMLHIFTAMYLFANYGSGVWRFLNVIILAILIFVAAIMDYIIFYECNNEE